MAGALKVWDGTQWVTTVTGVLSDDSGWVSGWATPPTAQTTRTINAAVVPTAKYRRIGNLVEIRFNLVSDTIYDMSASTSGDYGNANVWSGLPNSVCPVETIQVPIRLRDMNVQGALNALGNLTITGGPPGPSPAFPVGALIDSTFQYFIG